MIETIRVAIPIIGSKIWLGGVSYIELLVKAVHALPDNERPRLFLFITEDTLPAVSLHAPILPLFDGYIILGDSTPQELADAPVCRVRSYNELFQTIDFFYPLLSTVWPNTCSGPWIPDFQHIFLPHFFSEEEYRLRSESFAQIAASALLVIFSSQDSQRTFHELFPQTRAETRVLSFYSLPQNDWYENNPLSTARKYALPDHFVICCNQFWTHKNHALLFKAIAALRRQGVDLHLVCTGATEDYRAHDYFDTLTKMIVDLGIGDLIHITGNLPRADQIQLIRRAMAVIQPSLFEGWSTVVEDCRALGKVMILSDLPVHKEQAPRHGIFFDRNDPSDLVRAVVSLLPRLSPGPHAEQERVAREEAIELTRNFARQFCSIVLDSHFLYANHNKTSNNLNKPQKEQIIDNASLSAIPPLAPRRQNSSNSISLQQNSQKQYVVSAIVSTYNSEKFIRGKLEDLEAQTIADQLEIIVIDSGSQQNERAIVKEFQKHYSNIVYMRTEQRETVYQAWNRGIKAATGKFITNANTDDRLSKDCIEILVKVLNENPNKVLAYGDSIVTLKENETFDRCTPHDHLRWPGFDRAKLLEFCYVGPHPVWRREVHDIVGYFDESYQCAADYEFWLRLALQYEFLHVPELLGLYWLNEGTVSRKGNLPLIEASRIQEEYRKLYSQAAPLPTAAQSHPQAERRLSVLFVVHSFLPDDYGGVEIYTCNLAQELIAQGCEAAVLYPVIGQASPFTITAGSYQNIPTYKLATGEFEPITSIEHPETELAFEKFLNSHSFDIVHFHHTHQHLPFSLLEVAQKAGARVSLTLHDFWFLCLRTHLYVAEAQRVCDGPDSENKCQRCLALGNWEELSAMQRENGYNFFYFRQKRVKELMGAIDLVSAPSRFVADKFARYGYGGGIVAAPLGIKPIRRNRKKTGESLSLAYIGTIHEIKNVFALVEAFAATAGEARLLIHGNGQPDRIERLTSAITDPRIEYRGGYAPEDLHGILAEADAVIVPSMVESYCLTVREALSAGVPVLAANVGGIPEIVSHMGNGILFDPRNKKEMQEIIQQCIDNPSIIARLKPEISPIRTITEDAREWLARYRAMAEARSARGVSCDNAAVSRPAPGSFANAAAGAKNLKIAVFSLDLPQFACARLRILDPFAAAGAEVLWGFTLEGNIWNADPSVIDRADVILIQRFFPQPDTKACLEMIFASGKPVIFEMDDLLTNVPGSNPHKMGADNCAPLIMEVMARADAVTVSTEELKRAIAGCARKIYVLPNLIERRLWDSPPPRSNGATIIGFTGTSTHMADLALIEDAIVRIAERYGETVGFRFTGCVTDRLLHLPGAVYTPFVPSYASHVLGLQSSGIDIALVPLEDNPFNRCKSNIKWLEYSACGIAGIYADLPPYNASVRNGETGILAGESSDAWFNAMDILVRDRVMRENMALKAREEVMSRYTLETAGSRYLDPYREVTARGGYDCSIIIPLFNKAEYTLQCIEGVAKNTGDSISYEVILVDNGSTDGTRGLLQGLSGDVQIIRNDANLGFARACNQGAQAANGKYLVFLNNDTLPQPGWLEALVKGVEEDAAHICGAKLLYPNGRVQHAGVAFDERGIGYHIFNGFAADDPAVCRKRAMQSVTAACLLIRKELFQELKGFDEGYLNGYEDVDLCLRAGELGKRILYTPESILTHFEETSAGRKDHEKQNALRFIGQWGGRVRCDDNDFYRAEGLYKEALPDGKTYHIKRTPPETARREMDMLKIAEPRREERIDRSEAEGKATGAALKKEKRYAEALQSFERARVNGDNTVLADMGDCRLKEGKLDDAEKLYMEALEHDPADGKALVGMGVIQIIRGKTDESAPFFVRVLQGNEMAAKALCGLGLAWQMKEKGPDSFACFKLALETDPEELSALHEMVGCAYGNGRLEEAEGYLKRYIMYHPADCDMLFSLAGMLYREGKYSESRETAERLLAIAPEYEGGKELMTKLNPAREYSGVPAAGVWKETHAPF